MQFQIKHVILWSRDPKHKPRIVNFEVGRFNVLSGVSRTGKSAMIPIIDYCLGSEKCTIPSQTIRKACEWFGVVVETAEGQKLFARREPGPLRASGEAFISEARVVDIPHAIGKKTSTVDAVKNALNHVSQLSALSFSPDEEQGFRARASFRDLVSFVFQPQNIIANPNVLFYKADIAENREKLRTIFPYVLGAVTPAVLARMHELNDLRRELRRKATELNNAIKVSAEWEAQLETRLARAREFGLIRAATTSISRTEAIDLLRNLLDMAPEPRVTQETVTDAVKELDQLQREENSISREVTKLRRRYSEMTELQHNATEYQAALKVQADRLSA